MGVLGKDLFDIDRPRTHVKVHFGATGYWVEDDPDAIPYSAALTELLNLSAATTAPKPGSILRTYLSAGEDAAPIRERYTWFLEELLGDAVPEKKKGQGKKPLAELIYSRGLDALVSGASLGRKGTDVDAPQVNVQYVILEREDETHELVEKMYFDHLADFIYVEFMKGLQKGFVPKRCANCGRWFLQEPGLTYNYCKQVAPGETELTCRDIGSRASFRDKVKNNEVWQIHQRAYKKYFARTKKGTMTKTEFESWAREAEELREQALKKYKKAKDTETQKIITKELEISLNRL